MSRGGLPSIEDLIEAAVARALGGIREEIAALRRTLPPQLGSVADAAKSLGCSPRTVWRLIREGKLPHRKVGRKTVVDLASLHPPD
jgi:excisionase family DNA binding protein